MSEIKNSNWQLAIGTNKILLSAILLLSVAIVSCKQQPANKAVTEQPTPTPQNLIALSQPSPIFGKPWPGTGVVKFISLKEGWIEINHEEIVGLMPPMEMEWFVERKSLLENIAVGDKVNFIIMDTKDKGQIITELKKAK